MEPAEPVRPRLWIARSAWTPIVVLLCATAATLLWFDVSAVDMIKFGVYVAAAITLPGLLVYRALTRHQRTLGEDLAIGTALGYLIEIAAYVPARAVGQPLLMLALPASIIGVFAFVPRLREHWLANGRIERAAGWEVWSLVAAIGGLVFYTAATFYRVGGVTGDALGWGDLDMTFHLALAGELKHHFPPTVPYTGDALKYYWFNYADLAGTSWATGIEPAVLLRRLSLLPVIAATVVLIAVAARRLTGKAWTGPAAVAVTYLVIAPHPYGWTYVSWLTDFGFGVVDDGSQLRLSMWQSPTLTFGGVFFAAWIVLMIDLLQGRGGRGHWLMLVLLSIGIGGSKASLLPMLVGGAALVVLVELALRRRVNRVAVGITLVSAVGLAFSQIVMLGMTSGGLVVQPWAILTYFGIEPVTGILADTSGIGPWAGLAAVTVVCWALMWSGLAGLWRGRLVLRPELTAVLGVALTGLVASVTFAHPGMAQTYFIQGARPLLSIAAVCGLAAALSRVTQTRQTIAILVGAGVAGVASVAILRMVTPKTPPSVATVGSAWLVLLDIWWPYLVLIGLLAGVGVGLFLGRHRLPALTGLAVPVVLVMAMGFGMESALQDRLVTAATTPASRGWLTDPGPVISPGGVDAARWLRDHSAPNDIVATNAHCSPGATCLNLHFWISGLTERRVLVEGWGYTTRAHAEAERTGVSNALVPFHDPQRLADNDAAFAAPSPQTLSTLRERYGVRWLFVDRGAGPLSPDLGRFATLRFVSGSCEVYEISGETG